MGFKPNSAYVVLLSLVWRCFMRRFGCLILLIPLISGSDKPARGALSGWYEASGKFARRCSSKSRLTHSRAALAGVADTNPVSERATAKVAAARNFIITILLRSSHTKKVTYFSHFRFASGSPSIQIVRAEDLCTEANPTWRAQQAATSLEFYQYRHGRQILRGP